MIIIGGIIIGSIVSTSAIRMLQVDIDKEISAINNFLSSEELTENLDTVTQKVTLLEHATNYYTELKTASDNIHTQVKLNRALIEGFTDILPTNTSLTNFSYTSSSLSISCISDSEDKIANYVHRLRSLDSIYKVSYMGYAQEDDDSYYAEITITFRPGGGGYE